MKYYNLFISIFITNFILGCTYKVASLPANISSLETPATLEKGAESISINGGASGEIFGPEFGFMTFEYSEGLGENLELSLRPFVAKVTNGPEEGHDVDPDLYGMAIDFKKNPSDYMGPHFAIFGGGGYVYSAYAQMFSLHGGWILGYEKTKSTWFVPFMSQEVFVSIPVQAKVIPGKTDEVWYKPTETYGFKLSLGLKINIGDHVGVTAVSGLNLVESRTSKIAMLHIGSGLEWEF